MLSCDAWNSPRRRAEHRSRPEGRAAGKWTLTPQAQLSYSSVRFNSFTDPFDAAVSLSRSDALTVSQSDLDGRQPVLSA
nr:autotransporter outer membrane beta-barrel domain-containing protein [Mesorhizobium sp. B4-1-3]